MVPKNFHSCFQLFLFLIFLSLNAHMENQCFIRFLDPTTPEEKNKLEKKFGLVELRTFLLTEAVLYSIHPDSNASFLIPELRKEIIVKYADFNRKHALQEVYQEEPRVKEQWYLNNLGKIINNKGGSKEADIDWDGAIQKYEARKQRIVVSVIDTGIAADHPELTDKLAYMPAEVNGVLGIDDDGMGYIDDKYGWDFIGNDNDPADLNGHGTQVAGIIAAHSNNAKGISGIAPHAVILPLRVFNEYGGGATDDRILSALGYSVLGGVRIINLSLGKGSPVSNVLQEALFNLDKNYDLLMICAAGNGGSDGKGLDLEKNSFYPASYLGETVLAVAATNQYNELSPFSNYGKTVVDLAAPGSNMLAPDLSRKRFYYEDFQLGLSGWVTNGSSNHRGLPWEPFADESGNLWITDSAYDSTGGLLNYQSSTESSIISPVIDLTGLKSPTLSARIYHNLAQNFFFASYDRLRVEVSPDNGLSWNGTGTIYGRNMSGGSIYQFDLSKYEDMQIKLRFRLLTDYFRNADGIYLDDLEISGVSSFEDGTEQYAFVSGTSFAAPVVSGVAALLLANRPELSVREVREILLQSVTPIEGLKDKVASGGIVNAESALEFALKKKVFLDSGWHYHEWPWIYSSTENKWNFLHLEGTEILSFNEMQQEWTQRKANRFQGKWLFHAWPYLLDSETSSWYYLSSVSPVYGWRGKNQSWHFFDSKLNSWRKEI